MFSNYMEFMDRCAEYEERSFSSWMDDPEDNTDPWDDDYDPEC